MTNDRSSSTAASTVVVATASRQGTQGPIADAVRHYVAADLTTATAVIDGAGHEADVVAIAPILAEVAARNAAQHGAVRGVLSAAALVTDRGPDGEARAPSPPSWCALREAKRRQPGRGTAGSTDRTVTASTSTPPIRRSPR